MIEPDVVTDGAIRVRCVFVHQVKAVRDEVEEREENEGDDSASNY